MPDSSTYDRDYFAPRHRNVYWRLFGSKGYVLRWLRRNFPRDAAILDVGCGIGLFLEDLRDFPNRYGCDVSHEAVRLSRALNPEVPIELVTPAAPLPFTGVQFDCIALFDVIEHVENDRELILHAIARLRSGGILFVSTPNPTSIGKKIKRDMWFGHRDSTHVNIHEPGYFLRLLNDCGFAVEDIRYDGLWDAPYLLPVAWPERIFLQLPSVLLFTFGAIRFPALGENVWIRARKRE